MAGETANSPEKPAPGSRATPVLVPQGEFAGKPDLPLDRPVTTVGSRHTSRLHLLSRSVSKSHAVFVNSNGSTYVADLASRTGVLVNGRPVRQSELKTGDRVQIGKFLFRFRAPKAVTQANPIEPPPAMIEREGEAAAPLENRTFLIGRREGADIALTRDADVSASHAVIFTMNGDWYARDLGSRTGTRVNGKAIHQQKLAFGDSIEIGSTTFALAPAAVAAPGGPTDIADAGLEPEDSPQSSRIPLELDALEEEQAAESPERMATEDIGAPAPPQEEDDFGLEFEPELPTPAERISAPLPMQVDVDKNETLIPLDSDVAELDLSSEPAADEAQPTDDAETPGRLMVDLDLRPSDRLSSSGTHADLQREADEALAEARIDGAPVGDDSALAARPADAEPDAEPSIDQLDEIDLSPVDEEPPHAVRPAVPSAAQPPAPIEPLPLEEPHAEVSPRRGWRTSIPPAAAAPTPVDETPSPAIPEALPLEDFDLVDEPRAAAPGEAPKAQPPVSEAASAPPIPPIEPAPPVEELMLDDLRLEQPDVVEPAVPKAPGSFATALPQLSETAEQPTVVELPIEPASEPEPELRRAVTDPNVEILDRTEPTPDSALNLGDAAGSPTLAGSVGEMVDSGATLTDTTFGRAVDEFTGPSTGPIVEHVEDISYQDQASSSTTEKTAAAPATPRAGEVVAPLPVTGETFAPAPAHPPLQSDDLIVPQLAPAGETYASIDQPPVVSPTQRAAEAPLGLDDLADLEEFVAVPEDELAGSHVTLDELDDLARATTATKEEAPPPAKQPDAEPARAQATPVEPPPAAPSAAAPSAAAPSAAAPSAAAPSAAAPSAAAPPVTLASAPATPGAPAATPGKPGPSLFGFNFDGDSFLGGMPLKLGTPPSPAAAKPGKVDYAFNARNSNVAGQGASAPPAPTHISPTAIPPSIAANASTTLDADALLSEAPPVPARAPQRITPSPAKAPTRVTPPRPVMSPPIAPQSKPPPPPPVRPAGQSPVQRPAPRSLMDLASEPVAPPTEPPSIPSLAAELSVPPLARANRTAPQARRPLTTAFDGLATGAGVRNTDVFSQMSTISAEAFGTRRADPEDFAASFGTGGPVDSAAQDAARDYHPGNRPPGEGPRGGAHAPRRTRVPVLLGLMLFLAAAAWVLVQLYLPVYAQVTGALGFTNLASQPQREQNEFKFQQTKLLRDDTVRADAMRFVKDRKIRPGFLEDPIAYSAVIDKPGVISWQGPSNERLEVSYLDSDGESGKARLSAVLDVMAQRNRGLADALERARREAEDARSAVTTATVRRDELKRQIAIQRALGEDRPDPDELARLDEQAGRFAKARESATAARAAAEEALNQLRLMDTTKPLDPATDPQAIELRKQLQDVGGQIAALRAAASAADPVAAVDAGPSSTRPAAAALQHDELLKQLQDQANALNTKINQRLTAIQADQGISSEQRAVNRDKAVEDQSIRVKSLQDAEGAATEAATTAVAKARDARDRLDKSRSATTVIDDLVKQVTTAEADLKAAADKQKEKDTALAARIAPEGDGKPIVTVQAHPDQRPVVAGVASGIIVVIFCLMILSAHRAAHHDPGPHDQYAPPPTTDGSNGDGNPAAPSEPLARRADTAKQDEEPLTV